MVDEELSSAHTKTLLSKDRSRYVTDEFYNTLTSGLGTLLAVVGLYFLVTAKMESGYVGGFALYGLATINMFATSTLHHGINGSPRTNRLLRQLDYFGISFMIAGTFTPFCLVLESAIGWVVLVLVWIIAIATIVVKVIHPFVHRWVMTSLYIGMGWLALFIVKPVYTLIHWDGFFFMALGGIFYTVGGFIYGAEKPNPFPGKFGFHELWHCFVLAGAASHFYTIYHYL